MKVPAAEHARFWELAARTGLRSDVLFRRLLEIAERHTRELLVIDDTGVRAVAG